MTRILEKTKIRINNKIVLTTTLVFAVVCAAVVGGAVLYAVVSISTSSSNTVLVSELSTFYPSSVLAGAQDTAVFGINIRPQNSHSRNVILRSITLNINNSHPTTLNGAIFKLVNSQGATLASASPASDTRDKTVSFSNLNIPISQAGNDFTIKISTLPTDSGSFAIHIPSQNVSATINRRTATISAPSVNSGLIVISGEKFKETTYSLGLPSELGKIIDVNNDGLLDVIVLGERREKGKDPEGIVKIFYQTNDGRLSLASQEYSIEHGADMINAGDVNNDGLNDIVITTDDVSASVTAFLKQGPLNTFSLSFEPAPDLPTSAGSPDIGDINGNGLNDVVRGNKPRGSISIYYQNPNHSLQAPVEIPVGGGVERIWRTSDGRIGDYNNDGKNDFAVRNGVLLNGHAFFTVFYNLGNNNFNIVNYDTGVTSNMGLSDIRSADMDNNGQKDVVVSINEGNIGVYRQTSSGLEGRIYSSGLPSIRGLALGDINEDGRKDIITSSFNCSEGVSILIQKNDGSYNSPVRIYSRSGFGGMVEMGDVNNDGKEEIVTTNGLTLQTSNCPETSISVIEVNRSLFTN